MFLIFQEILPRKLRLQITSSFYFPGTFWKPFYLKNRLPSQSSLKYIPLLRTIHCSAKCLFTIQKPLPSPQLPEFINPKLLQHALHLILNQHWYLNTCQTRSPKPHTYPSFPFLSMSCSLSVKTVIYFTNVSNKHSCTLPYLTDYFGSVLGATSIQQSLLLDYITWHISHWRISASILLFYKVVFSLHLPLIFHLLSLF